MADWVDDVVKEWGQGDAVIPDHCEQGDCTAPVQQWCPLCERFLCLAHDPLVPERHHDCLGGPAGGQRVTQADSEWRKLTPAEFADAVDFDERIRNAKMHGEQFVHRSFLPLAEVDLRSEQDRGQLEFDFDGCGVLCPAGAP